MPTIQQPRQDTPIRVFQKTNEERKAFLIEIQTLKEYREELIKSHTTWTNFISELRNNILNSDVFKAFSYICKVLKTFSEAPQTTNFINNFRIELQKISKAPLFQAVKEFESLKDRLHVPDDELLKLKESFYISIQNQNVKIFQEAIYNFKKDHGFILSKKSIAKYFIDEYIFISREHKDIKELCKDRVVINALEKLKIENKQYQNISIENGINQAFSYFKELEEKDLPPLKKDDRKSQYSRQYKKSHGDFCYIISNLLNTVFFFCCGIYSKSTKKKKDNKEFHQIKIYHQANHPIIIYADNPFTIEPIYKELWALLLQEINCKVRAIKERIFKAWKNNEILEEDYRKVKLSINEYIALKAPANFGNYRSKKIPFIQNFCDLMAEMSMEGEYINFSKWEEFNGKLFDSISINNNFEIEAILTDKFIKVNRLTMSSQMLFPIASYSAFDTKNYKDIFSLVIQFFNYNRINSNEIEKRIVIMQTIIKWIGFNFEELKTNRNISKLTTYIYNYLRELIKLGFSFSFDNKDLSKLQNYKWNSKKKIRDSLNDFEQKQINFSFDDKMEKILRNNTPKNRNEYYLEAKTEKEKK